MIIKEDNELSFVFDSKEMFCPAKSGPFAEIEIGEGKKAVVSVSKHCGQYHVEAELPMKIRGKTAFRAYEEFAASDDNLFGLYIDPVNGMVKVVEHLESATAADLDRVIEEIHRVLSCAWDRLEFFADEASRQSPEDKNAFDISGIIFSTLQELSEK